MNQKQGVFLVILTALISGFSIFINKWSVSKIEPYTFTFLKNTIVALFLLSLVFFTKELKIIKKITKKQWFQLIMIGLIGGSIPFLLFFKGLSLTSASMGSFIHKTLFIYASIFAVIFLKEKIPKRLCFIAVFLLIGNFLLLKLTAFTFGKGEFFILIATLLWGIENILSKYALKELSGNIVAFGRMLFGSFFILLFIAFTNKLSLLAELNFNDVVWTVFTSLLLLLFVTTYYNGLKAIKVSVATSILLLGSPITTLLSFAFTNGTIDVIQWVGILLNIIGIIAVIFFGEFTKKGTTLFRRHTHNG